LPNIIDKCRLPTPWATSTSYATFSDGLLECHSVISQGTLRHCLLDWQMETSTHLLLPKLFNIAKSICVGFHLTHINFSFVTLLLIAVSLTKRYESLKIYFYQLAKYNKFIVIIIVNYRKLILFITGAVVPLSTDVCSIYNCPFS
jgi:hypothetical protein